MKKPLSKQARPWGVYTLQLVHLFKAHEVLSNTDVFVALKKRKKDLTKQWVYQTISNLKARGILKRVSTSRYKRETKLPAIYNHLFK